MHSWASARNLLITSKTRYKIITAAAQRLHNRSISTRSSNNPSPSSLSVLRSNGGSDSNNGSDHQKSSNYNPVLAGSSLFSGAYVVGLSLGLVYWSSLPDQTNYPRISYADSQAQATEPEKKPKFIIGDAYRRSVFFKYEKRIRTRSPPEKIFEYFASYHSPDGEVFMMPEDLMRAVVPVFPPSETTRVRGGSLKGEWVPCELRCRPSKFFMLFDTNNDGLISFAEYIFFVTLLSIPESSFSVAFKMFDLDHNGKIDMEEFKKVMALMRSHNRQGARHRDGLRIGLKVSGSVENGGLLEYFFGKDGKGYLDHGTFVQFLRDLQEEILRLEFAHYDHKSQGTISAKDFALSMVASADMKHINKFLDRVDELESEPQLKDIRITFDEFKNLAELRKSLRPLSLAIFSYGKVNGLLTKQDFQRASYHVCGISLTDNVVDMIFYVFDSNRDGSISSEEFLRVLQKREGDNLQPREAGILGMFSCWYDCTNNSSSRIVL